MTRWFEDKWYRIVHRYRCPYPVIADFSARACVAAGLCGCDNRKRYPQGSEEANG